MAQIESVQAENWRCFKQLSVKLGPRVVVMSDDPGPGKSTLLDAVIYTVLGSCRGTGPTGRGSDALRMMGADAAEIELGIRDEEGLWQLGRRIGKSGGPYMREDGRKKQSGFNLRFEEAYGIPAPAAFPSLRPREFLAMPHEEREKIVLTACGTFRVAGMIEKAGDLWPADWSQADVLELLGETEPLTVKDGMQRIHNKARDERQAEGRHMRDLEALVGALSKAAEDVAPEVKPPTEEELLEARADVDMARRGFNGLKQRNRERVPLEQSIRDLGQPVQSVMALKLRLEGASGDRGKVVPVLHKARDAVEAMNKARAEAELPPIHRAEELGDPPEINVGYKTLAEKGCPACRWIESQPNVKEKCPFTKGEPQVAAHVDAHEKGVQSTYADALKALQGLAAAEEQETKAKAAVDVAEAALDAAKKMEKELAEAVQELGKLGEAVPAEDIDKASSAATTAEAKLEELVKASGAGGAAKGVKNKAVAAKRARTKAQKLVALWQALETVTDPAGALAERWLADIGSQFVETLPGVSEQLAPADALPEGVDPIRAVWADSECHIIRHRRGMDVGIPWRLSSRGEQTFGALAVAVAWAMVTGCLLVVGDDIDSLGNLLPAVLDGIYGQGEAGNVLLAGVGATMTAALSVAKTGDKWQIEEVGA